MTFVVIAFQFWKLRGNVEYMIKYAHRYCEKNDLQYISLARSKTRFKAYKGTIDWHISYELAFSSDGETEYVGHLTAHGKHIIKVDLPAYRID